MKKYSLTFHNLLQEQNYQKDRAIVRKPIYYTTHLFMLLICFVKMIMDLQNSLYVGFPALISFQSYIIISIILIYKRPQYIQYAMLLFNYFLVYYEWQIKGTISIQALPLFVSNCTIGSVIVILTLDVSQSTFLIITTFSFKIINTTLEDSQQSYNAYVAGVIIMFFSIYCSWKLNLQSRHNFLLAQKDNIWGIKIFYYYQDKILNQVVEDPFLLFQYDEDKLEFVFHSSKELYFSCNNTQETKIFLRQWQYNSQNLEQYFFQLNKKNSKEKQQFQNTVIIQNGKVKVGIHYSIFNYQQPTFLIKFKDQTNIKQQYKQLVVKEINQQRIIQFKLLKCIIQNLQFSSHLSNLILLRKSCCKQILNLKVNYIHQKAIFISLPSLIQQVVSLFSYKNIDVQITDSKLQIKTVKCCFQRLLFEIFENCFYSSEINFTFNEHSYHIYYQGSAIGRKKIELNKVLSTLVIKQSIYDKIKIDLELLNEPNIPFDM